MFLHRRDSAYCSSPALSPLELCSGWAGSQQLPQKTINATLTKLLELPYARPIAEPSLAWANDTAQAGVKSMLPVQLSLKMNLQGFKDLHFQAH